MGTALTGVGFTDRLPDGLVVATPSGLGEHVRWRGDRRCRSRQRALAGAALPPAACTITVNVTGLTVGAGTTTSAVTSTEGGAGGTASARLGVLPSSPPIPTPRRGRSRCWPCSWPARVPFLFPHPLIRLSRVLHFETFLS
jgi:hypothetical protein